MTHRRWLYPAILIALVLAAVEGMSFFTGQVLARRGVLYRALPMPDYADYLARRDPEVGWPALSGDPDSAERDAAGSRLVPAFADPEQRSCGSLYGDSFTWSAQVGPEASWANVLSQRFGCRVANYGVQGYGSDQAFMRYRRNTGDDARFVVLGHLSENVMRNVNQYRALLYATALTGLKPRFVLGRGGELESVPLPDIPASEYADFVRAPERVLEHEYFAPGGRSGMSHFAFPYSIAVLRAFGHFHVRAELEGVPWFAEFYRPEHPSRALQVTLAIFRAFEREARVRGQTPIALVIATGNDFDHYRASGEWVYQPLVDALREEGLEVIDGGQTVIDRIGERDHCELFTDCSGHYAAEGYELLARIVGDRIEALSLVP